MDSIARNALRLSLAGAGVAVLGAGFVAQASAAELPDAPSAPEAPETSQLTDSLPADVGNDVTTDFGALEAPSPAATSTEAPSTESAPTSDVLFDDLPALEIPGMMYIEVPTVS
ncbi:hypothetical protein [Pseudonocardia sp. KRD291]|uniref:hypothetical protein n=1 Tax=Pseudonocardia sp. KRD291 TaxID=2792007 RepID=UPI001C4A32D8|nr:hypothetical protein [Pseudonocardia sp. KRD291]MBW0103109.1 hypothetical protein [Pseudonocardia sp. KRD291]